MKQLRAVKNLVIILVLLVTVIAIRANFSKIKQVKDEYGSFWGQTMAQEITEVVVEGETAKIELVKTGTDWKTGDYLADSKALDAWLEKLIEADKPEKVAETKSSHDRLGVGDKAIRLNLKSGETIFGVRLGSETTGGRYLRLDDQEAVYLVADLPTTINSTNQNDWVDKKLTDYMQAEITKLQIEYNKSKITLNQIESKWFEEGKTIELDSSLFSTGLMNISTLTTDGLIDDQMMKLKTPEVTVKMTANGQEVELSFYPLDEVTYGVKANTRFGLFAVTNALVESLKISAEDLVPKPSPTPTAN